MIKKMIMVFCALAIAATEVLAAFPIPQYVYTISNLQQAKKEAQGQNKAILFVYSDKNTTCPLAARASNDAINGFKNRAVIVYISNSDRGVPQLVVKALNSPAGGELIPKCVIIDPYIKTVIDIIPYKRNNRIVLLNAAVRKINEYFGKK